MRFTAPLLLLTFAAQGQAQGAFPTATDARGCRVERLAFGGDRSYHQFHGLSPDGKRLVVGWETLPPNQPAHGAFLLDLESGQRIDLPGLNNAASFSPDGQRLVSGFQTGAPKLRTEIVEYDLASNQLKFLAPDSTGDWLPTYSPDGKSVLFNSYRTGGSDLYQLARVQGTLERLTDDSRYDAHAQFSPDGRYVAFHRQMKDNDYAIAILDLETRAVRLIADTPREEAYPAWSPDGQRIVFSSDRDSGSGDSDLYLVTRANEVVTRLTGTRGKDTYPDWSSDGRYIYFNSGRSRDAGTDVYRIEMSGDDCRRSR